MERKNKDKYDDDVNIKRRLNLSWHKECIIQIDDHLVETHLTK